MISGKKKRSSLFRALVLWCLLIPAALLSGACGGEKSGNAAPANEEKPNPASPQKSDAPPPTENTIDRGDFKLLYQEPKKTRRDNNQSSLASIVDKQALEGVIVSLNQRISLPVDIGISFENCNDPNAYYDLESHSVSICYQLIDEFRAMFRRDIKDPEELKNAVRGATVSVLFHELGHALIDVWKLPVTGKEEDAADQLATLALMSRSEKGEEMALHGAVLFMLSAEVNQKYEKIYWDEHSLDEQRFYDTICLIYGQHPDKYAYLVENGTLPEPRAELCPEESARINRAWQTLLSPYLK